MRSDRTDRDLAEPAFDRGTEPQEPTERGQPPADLGYMHEGVERADQTAVLIEQVESSPTTAVDDAVPQFALLVGELGTGE